ncbi:MAG TPA: hypothetical protein ENK18_13650 [Deltaproteobacteria bacterium]|nr:hypothetical protein [Deltaproteobacteria bacterium]
MDTEVVVALIAAITAAGTSLVSVLWNMRSLQHSHEHQESLRASDAQIQRSLQEATAELQRRSEAASLELEQLRSQLQLERDAADSRRSYEFEGLRRLYERYEPLRFQLMEATLHAGWRVQSLARSARLGDIRPDGSGWMEDSTGYYLAITVYELMLPAVLYRIMRRCLTFVDFSLEARIEWEYRLARSYTLGLSNDFSLAAFPGAELPYEPGVDDWRERRRITPAQHWRQGLSIGILDSFLEQMTQQGPDGALEPISFGAFYDRIRRAPTNTPDGAAKDPLQEQYPIVADVFLGFHPTTRPVLWRVLLYQVVFAHAYFRSWQASRSGDTTQTPHQIPDLPEALVEKYTIGDGVDVAAEIRIATERARKETEYAFSL